MNSKTALVFVIPGSVSLFVLLQFLQEAAITQDGMKFSNLFALRRGAAQTASSDFKDMIADINDQFILLLVITILFLAPPLVWLLVNLLKSIMVKRKLRSESDGILNDSGQSGS